jgi:hypothetical protein
MTPSARPDLLVVLVVGRRAGSPEREPGDPDEPAEFPPDVRRLSGYVLGAPAIPLMNLPRALVAIASRLPPAEVARTLPSILLHIVASRAGEALGYLTGREADLDFLHAHQFSFRSRTPAP